MNFSMEKKMKKYIVLLGLLAVLATPLFAQERFEDIMVRLDKAAAKAYLEQVQKAEKYRLDGIHPSLHQDIIDRIRQIHPSVSLVANLGKIHELYARSVETPSETFVSYYVLVVTPDEEFTDRYYFYQVKIYHRNSWDANMYELRGPRLLTSGSYLKEDLLDVVSLLKNKLGSLKLSLEEFRGPLTFADKTFALAMLKLYPLPDIKKITAIETLSHFVATQEGGRDRYRVNVTFELENNQEVSHIFVVDKAGPDVGDVWHLSAPRVSVEQ